MTNTDRKPSVPEMPAFLGIPYLKGAIAVKGMPIPDRSGPGVSTFTRFQDLTRSVIAKGEQNPDGTFVLSFGEPLDRIHLTYQPDSSQLRMRSRNEIGFKEIPKPSTHFFQTCEYGLTLNGENVEPSSASLIGAANRVLPGINSGELTRSPISEKGKPQAVTTIFKLMEDATHDQRADRNL